MFSLLQIEFKIYLSPTNSAVGARISPSDVHVLVPTSTNFEPSLPDISIASYCLPQIV